MSFTLECPFCSKEISVPDEMAGQTAPCPSCGQEIYLTRDDAAETGDPVIDRMRRKNEAQEREHQDHLRAVMQMQDQNRRTRAIVKWLIYIFIVFPLAFWLLWFFVLFVYGCFSGNL